MLLVYITLFISAALFGSFLGARSGWRERREKFSRFDTGSEQSLQSAEFSLLGASRDRVLTNKREPRPGRVDIHVNESEEEAVKFLNSTVWFEHLSYICSRMSQDWIWTIERISGSLLLPETLKKLDIVDIFRCWYHHGFSSHVPGVRSAGSFLC